MTGRKRGAGYNRFGFNGKEFDWEAKGWMNQYDFGLRIYDPRIGRFLSMDPIIKEYESPYAAFANNPISIVDPDGADTAKAFKVGIYQSVLEESSKKMQSLGEQIKNYQVGIKALKDLYNQQVTLDLFQSFNIYYFLPQMGSDAINGGSVQDYMASTIATRVGELEGLVQQYNQEYEKYQGAAKSLQLAFKNATHFDVDGVVLERLGGGARAATLAGAMHKNSKAAESTYVLYEIVIEGETFKFGIADAGRVRKGGQFAGLPERLAQQLSKINKYAPELAVSHKIHTILQTTKAEMIKAETATIRAFAERFGIPIGNAAHIKKWAATFGKAGLSAKAVQALSKFLKF